jgi:glutathione synthase/RimK-type ligase-like ATP-grasp enzyme
MFKKIKSIILKNESAQDHESWIAACENRRKEIEYRIVDITLDTWFDEIINKPYDIILAKPGGISTQYKQLYDERIYILDSVIGRPIYPTANEIFIYENKRNLSYWLKANNIPHPNTHVFYSKIEAKNLQSKIQFPVVAKTNLGASGSGVYILQNEKDFNEYLDRTFSGKGAPQRWWPNFNKGRIIRRGLHYCLNPKDIKHKLDLYATRKNDVQYNFVIFQDYIPHEFEWRIVVIGDSYFAHKKLKIGDKASGSTLKKYDNPPLNLFDFARDIMERSRFLSQAIDIFENKDGTFLVNEMQCMFGQSDPYQMLVDGKPARYRNIHNKWIAEEGNFNTNENFDLRIDHVIKIMRK